jgi:uncharacterized membrane protein YhhN
MDAQTALTVITAVSVCACLVAVYRESRKGRIAGKMLASAGFVSVALTGGAATSSTGRLLLLGLVLGAFGDAFLLGSGTRALAKGLGAFLLGHIAYLVALVSALGTDASIVLWSLPVLAGGGAVAVLWSSFGRLRIPALIYVMTIALMCGAALNVARLDALSGRASLLVAIGGIAFMASDAAVARERFVRAAFANRLWGLPLYYAAQLCFAWAAGLVS